MQKKKIYSIIFKEDGRAFGLYVNSPGDGGKDEESSAIIYKEVPASLDIILKNKVSDFKIDFFPQGNSNGGIIEVKDKRDRTFFIIINRVTGRVEVKKNLK